jgi:hypothetical protein
LLGVDQTEQLRENIAGLKDGELSQSLIDKINKIQVEETQLLNPANWS